MNQSHRIAHRLLPLLLSGLLSACTTVGPDYQQPASAIASQPAAAQVLQGLPDAASRQPLPDDWWQLYHDPLLDALVREALASNRNLQTSWHQLRQADAEYRMALHGQELEVGGKAFAGRGQVSSEGLGEVEQIPVMALGDVGVEAQYPLDLFGQLKRATEAASADRDASAAGLDLARIGVVASVVGQYVTACHASEELAIAGESLQIQQRQLEVARRLLAAGRGNEVDVARAEAQTATLSASLPPFQARRSGALNALSALLGRLPGDLPAGVAGCAHAPQLQAALPVGDGNSLLRRRPDIRAAERQLAAATARIGVATAMLYPQISLGTGFGYTGMLEHVGDPITRFWNIGPHISWHLPTEVDHARIQAREAGADAALAHFDAVVLDALAQVRTQLEQYARNIERTRALSQARDAARTAASYNRRLYQEGRLDYLASLDAERTLASAEASLAASRAQLSQDEVKLFLALGGGWQGSQTPAARPAH